MTEADYLALDDAEETDLEYYDGAAWRKGFVDRNHGVLAGQLTFALELHCRGQGGEQGPERRVLLNDGRYQKPDAAYWLPGIPKGNDSLPTLAIEVRSPDETMASQRRKCRRYRESGIPVTWLIDPISRTAEVFEDDLDGEPVPAGGMLRSELIPGLEISLTELWAALDR
jgi:Uma2 family endonuclease